MSSDAPKLVFHLTQRGDLMEVRLAAPGGECRVETRPPSATIPAQMAALAQTGAPEPTLVSIGQALYGCLASGDAAELVSETLRADEEPGAAAHFELRFDPDQAALAQFPWETIADPAGRFLVRDGLVALTRYISYPQPPAIFDAELDRQPLLRVIAQPAGLPPVAAGELGLTGVETLEHATFESLQQKLLIQRLSAWGMHFDGHGGLMMRCRKCSFLEPPGALLCSRCSAPLSDAPTLGVLLFEKNDGYDLITTEELGAVLYNAGIRFALLSACESASVAGASLFNGLAPGLMTAGVPAVIGMQYRISDDFASSFAVKFYAALIQQKEIVQALTVARAMLLRSAWYSPALYLRQHQAADEQIETTYETRDIDTAVPAAVMVRTPFLVRLWIRRPETPALTEEQLRVELGVPERIAVSTRTAEADVKFEPVTDRRLRRGEVIVRLTSPACEIVPPSIKLFVDERLEAPPAIFTATAIQPGPASLVFSIWQDDGQIASVAHPLQVLGLGRRPEAGIRTGTHAVPVQPVTLPWVRPQPPGTGEEVTGPPPTQATVVRPPTRPGEASTTARPTPPPPPAAPQSRQDLRRWLSMVALLWLVAGLAAPLTLTTLWDGRPNPLATLVSIFQRTPSATGPVPIVTATQIGPISVVTPRPPPPPPKPLPPPGKASPFLAIMLWPTLVILFGAVQIVAASLYWRNRRSNRLNRWLPLTLLVGSLSLLVGFLFAVAILFQVL